MTDDSKARDRTGKDADEKVAGNPPVSPVDNFDLQKVDKDRRIFGNGDTDREDRDR
jgi:hypothetical protein